mgnify:CR=1 FL=1
MQEQAQRLDDWTDRLGHSLGSGLERRRARLANAAAGLTRPDKIIEMEARRLSSEARALKTAGRAAVDRARGRLGQASALLESYSYQRVLDRGFALVTDPAGAPVTSAKILKTGDRLDLRLRDGTRPVVVAGGAAPAKTATSEPDEDTPAKPKTNKPGDDRQGRLL